MTRSWSIPASSLRNVIVTFWPRFTVIVGFASPVDSNDWMLNTMSLATIVISRLTVLCAMDASTIPAALATMIINALNKPIRFMVYTFLETVISYRHQQSGHIHDEETGHKPAKVGEIEQWRFLLVLSYHLRQDLPGHLKDRPSPNC